MFPKEKQNHDSIGASVLGRGLWKNIFKKETAPDEIITTLRQVPLFEGMTNSELNAFSAILHRRRFRQKETVFRTGDPGAGMYILERGSVAIYTRNVEHKREELARLGPGEFFGELALVDESPRSATAVALERSYLLGLLSPDLRGLIDRQPRLGNKFLFQLASLIGQRLKHTNVDLQNMRSDADPSKMIT